jgi:hypothetical protein
MPKDNSKRATGNGGRGRGRPAPYQQSKQTEHSTTRRGLPHFGKPKYSHQQPPVAKAKPAPAPSQPPQQGTILPVAALAAAQVNTTGSQNTHSARALPPKPVGIALPTVTQPVANTAPATAIPPTIQRTDANTVSSIATTSTAHMTVASTPAPAPTPSTVTPVVATGAQVTTAPVAATQVVVAQAVSAAAPVAAAATAPAPAAASEAAFPPRDNVNQAGTDNAQPFFDYNIPNGDKKPAAYSDGEMVVNLQTPQKDKAADNSNQHSPHIKKLWTDSALESVPLDGSLTVESKFPLPEEEYGFNMDTYVPPRDQWKLDLQDETKDFEEATRTLAPKAELQDALITLRDALHKRTLNLEKITNSIVKAETEQDHIHKGCKVKAQITIPAAASKRPEFLRLYKGLQGVQSANNHEYRTKSTACFTHELRISCLLQKIERADLLFGNLVHEVGQYQISYYRHTHQRDHAPDLDKPPKSDIDLAIIAVFQLIGSLDHEAQQYLDLNSSTLEQCFITDQGQVNAANMNPLDQAAITETRHQMLRYIKVITVVHYLGENAVATHKSAAAKVTKQMERAKADTKMNKLHKALNAAAEDLPTNNSTLETAVLRINHKKKKAEEKKAKKRKQHQEEAAASQPNKQAKAPRPSGQNKKGRTTNVPPNKAPVKRAPPKGKATAKNPAVPRPKPATPTNPNPTQKKGNLDNTNHSGTRRGSRGSKKKNPPQRNS